MKKMDIYIYIVFSKMIPFKTTPKFKMDIQTNLLIIILFYIKIKYQQEGMINIHMSRWGVFSIVN